MWVNYMGEAIGMVSPAAKQYIASYIDTDNPDHSHYYL